MSLVRAVSTVSRHAHARQREGLGGGEDGAEVKVSALEAEWVAAVGAQRASWRVPLPACRAAGAVVC